MISIRGRYFHLDTPNTTYLFKANSIGTLEHIYYGPKIPVSDSYPHLEEQCLYGGGVMERGEDGYALYPNCASFEVSALGRGDFRVPSIVLDRDGDRVNEFLFESAEVIQGEIGPKGLPASNGKAETLRVRLIDAKKRIALILFYSLFEDSDVIVRSAEVINESYCTIQIEKLASFHLDFVGDDYDLVSLDGAWAKERMIHERPVVEGTVHIDSRYGFSSAQHNPYVVLKKKGCGLSHGEAMGFNLLYSGSFDCAVEKNNYHKIRIMEGIHPDCLSFSLEPGASFPSPEATLCYSKLGTNGLTAEYHRFVNEHIVRGYWKGRERPILLNNWEGTHFDFNEAKLLSMAKRAKELGVELFVLDDGWFGHRNNDKTSLGDWDIVNHEKLPDGLSGLSKKIHDLGLSFGLWFEPEMISEDSELFRAHPDWAVRHPDYEPLRERNQLVLDLTNDEVVEYLIDTLTKCIEDANLDYVKWDCNRNISDPYSPTLNGRQGEFHHRYMLGFYRLVKTIVERFPNVLFESCSAGGNRADLGLLCYMPQFWCSDNTDCYDRAFIQEGTLTGYPQSTIGAHVSAAPNVYTMRRSFFDSRFNIACFGAFGYELDLDSLTLYELKAMKDQIAWYKKHRKLLQFGSYQRIASLFTEPIGQWEVVSNERDEAIVAIQNKVGEVYARHCFLTPIGLDEDAVYDVSARVQYFPCDEGKKPSQENRTMPEDGDLIQQLAEAKPLPSERMEFTLPGEALLASGIRLPYEWLSGNGPEKRMMLDFGSRLYEVKRHGK